MQKSFEDSPKKGKEFTIDDNFWNNSFMTIDGKTIKAESCKGRYLLLNFWGEWCKPCLEEIPELVKLFNSYSRDTLNIISFLNCSKIETAKNIIKEQKMTWDNVIAAKKLLEQFKIYGYPTNILILPDGKTGIIYGPISADFFRKYMK
jgi:thiol-disulfide isomerase/thioredoxin